MERQDLRIQLLLPPYLHLDSERMLEFPLASIPRHRRLATTNDPQTAADHTASAAERQLSGS
jgi:hypothetical protein